MSLVNRMLLDLEQRQSALQGEPALAGLSSVDYCTEEEQRQRGTGRVVRIAAALFVAGLLAMALDRIGAGPAPVVVPVPDQQAGVADGAVATVPEQIAVTAPPAPAATAEIITAPITALSLRLDDTFYSRAQLSSQESNIAADPVTEEPAPTAAPANRAVTAMSLVPTDRGATLEVELNAEARYLAYALEKPSRVVIEIPGTALQGDLPQADGTGAVQRFRGREERGKTILVMDLSGPAASVNAGMVPTGTGARLRVEVARAENPVQSAPAAPAADMTSGSAPASVIEPGYLQRTPVAKEDLYTSARTLCSSGRAAACLGKLTELLAVEPGHVEGRLLLASALVENGDPGQAAATLEQGLADQPGVWQWAQLRAQLAINAGDAERAIAVLAGATPPLAEQPQYHALLAAVQQRTGRHEQAVATYHRVLAQRPERGVWWMGLGISLQELARDREAGFAYMRALEDATLSTDLRRFIEQRKGNLADQDKA